VHRRHSISNAFLGLCHSLAHALGSEFHIAHGVANALLIQQIVEYNGVNDPYKTTAWPQYKEYRTNDQYHKIANVMLSAGNGIFEDELVEDGCYGAVRLNKVLSILKDKLEIPRSIKECGINKTEFMEAVDRMAAMAWDDQCTLANPRFPLFEDIKQIYIDAYYGRLRAHDQQRHSVQTEGINGVNKEEKQKEINKEVDDDKTIFVFSANGQSQKQQQKKL